MAPRKLPVTTGGFGDKEFIVADSHLRCTKQKNVYATWTRFLVTGAGVGGDSSIYFSQSADGGATWSAATNLTPKSKFGPTAQWMHWSGVTSDGKTLWVAYYDRSYGKREITGCNDITLASVKHPACGSSTVSYQRVTTSSMPNLVVANNQYVGSDAAPDADGKIARPGCGSRRRANRPR
jgi:hypothetical protein